MRLRRSAILSVVQAIVTIIATFGSFQLLIRGYGLEALGLWSVTVGAVSFARLADAAGGSALARLVPACDSNGEYNIASLVETSILFSIILYLSISIIAYYPLLIYLRGVTSYQFTRVMPILLVFAFISLIASSISGAVSAALDGLQRADIRAAANIGGGIVFLLLSIILVPKYGVIGMAIAQLMQFVSMILIGWPVLYRLIPDLNIFPHNWSKFAFRASFSYGMRLQFLSLAGILFDPAVRLIINSYAGTHQLGRYEIAYRLVGYGRQLIVSATTPLVPAFALLYQTSIEKMEELLKKSNLAVVISSGVGFSGVIFISPIASIILLGHIDFVFLQFVIALSIGFFCNTITVPIYNLAQGCGILRWNGAGQIIIAVLAMIFTWLSIWLFGPASAASGMGGGLIIGSAVTFIGNSHHFRVGVTRLMPMRWLAGATGLVVVTAALLWQGRFVIAALGTRFFG